MQKIGDIKTNIPKSGHTSDLADLTEKERIQWMVDSLNRSAGDINDGYDCEKCHNKGFIALAVEHNGHWYENVRPCKCMKARKMLRRLSDSGLKGVVEKYSFDKFQTEDAWQTTLLQAAKEYAANPKGWFFIGGQSGAGKTFLCTAISVQLLRQQMEVRYMLWRDEAAAIKAIITESAEYQRRVDELKNVEVLYIDDLFKAGSSGVTTGDINLAFEIINYRYMKNKTTIISTEQTIQQLLVIDEAIAGRIAELAGGNCFNIRKDGSKNFRTKHIKEL